MVKGPLKTRRLRVFTQPGPEAACRDSPKWTFIPAGLHFLLRLLDIDKKFTQIYQALRLTISNGLAGVCLYPISRKL